MKIAIVIEAFDVQKGGQERSTFEIAELLTARGMDVTLVTAESDGLPEGAKSKLINLTIEHPSRAKRYEIFAEATNRLFEREKFDIVHAITPVPRANVYQPRGGVVREIFQRNLARTSGPVRWIRELFGPNPRMKRIEKMERFLAEKTECTFLAVSEYVRQQCREHLGLADERVKVIFNGVDLKRLPAEGNAEERQRLRKVLRIGERETAGMFVATNFKLKGLDTLINAALVLRENYPEDFSRLKLIIAGPDKNRRYFTKVERLGLAERFLFLGPAGDIASLYHLADFLLHPTWYDPCSRVVLEAMACGLPAVSTRYNGASELLASRNCGFVVSEPSDVKGLAEAWRRLMDEGKRAEFARNGLAYREKISMDHHVVQLIEFYETKIMSHAKCTG